MRENFGISFRAKFGIAVADQILFKQLIIFDHPVMHERELAAGVKVRVRVFVGHFAVRSPACVTDTKAARKRSLFRQSCKRRDASGTFTHLQISSIYNSDAGGVIASIFEAAQTFE